QAHRHARTGRRTHRRLQGTRRGPDPRRLPALPGGDRILRGESAAAGPGAGSRTHPGGRPMTAVAADRIESAGPAYTVAAQLASELAGEAAWGDGERRLPYAELDRLAASGLLAIPVPAAFGGADLPPSAVAEVVRRLAIADPNIAQIPHSHFVYVNL